MSTRAPERTTLSSMVTLPSVNLLPPEILVARKLRRVKAQLAGGGLVAILVVVALFLLAMSSVTAADRDLTTAKAQRAALQTQDDKLAHVRQTYALVDQANGLLRDAGGNEVLWSTYLGDLGPLLPSGAWLTKVTVGSGAAAAPAAPGAPATQSVAQITFEGTALSHVNVALWLESIAKERGWVNASFSRSQETLVGTRKVYGFSSTVTVTATALSGRYLKPAGS